MNHPFLLLLGVLLTITAAMSIDEGHLLLTAVLWLLAGLCFLLAVYLPNDDK